MTTVTANYYPNQRRLDFLDAAGLPAGGIMGNYAHLRAAQIMMQGNAIVSICLDSEMNKKINNKVLTNKQ